MRLAIVGLALSLFAAAESPARADVTPIAEGVIYDAVDAVTTQQNSITVDGVIHGAATSTSQRYTGFDPDTIARCDRYALLLITKPGKYQFVISAELRACQLIVRNP